MAARRYEIFSSIVEKYSTSEHSERVKYFQHEKRNFVSPCNVLLIISTPVECQTTSPHESSPGISLVFI